MSTVFETSKSGKQVKCQICECCLPSNTEAIKKSHVNGKGHKMKLQRKEEQKHILKHSIYVKGFDPLLPNLEEELTVLFEKEGCGKVKDVYIDKNSAGYCFVQFQNEESVAKTLSSTPILLQGKTMTIKPRMHGRKPEKSTNKEGTQNPAVQGSLPSEVIRQIQNLTELKDQMNILRKNFQLTSDDLKMRSLICELLQSVLEEVYPNCQVLQFGSSVNGVGCGKCDLDVTLLTNSKDDDSDKENPETMKEIREILERFAPGFKNVYLVESQKNCSIIKLHHIESNLNVDLSVNNRFALENTELLKTYIGCNVTIKNIIFTLRKWAKLNLIIGRGCGQVSNYAFTLMIIHFLQQSDPAYLECLQTCHEVKENKINVWNCSFCKEHSPSKELPPNLGQLLCSFFKYYAEKSFDDKAIVIHTTREILKKECNEDLNVTPLVVQDPFKLSHNVAQNVTDVGILKIKQIFCACYAKFEHVDNLGLLDVLTKVDYQKVDDKSNIYTITLPNCQHGKVGIVDLKIDCFVITKSILIDDLKMVLSYDSSCKDNNEEDLTGKRSQLEGCTVTDYEIKDNTNTDIKGETESKKRKLPEDESSVETCASAMKRAKVDKSFIEFTATSYQNTWTSRRKQRRLLAQKMNATRQDIATSSDVSESPIFSGQNALLAVRFHLKKAEKNSENCTVSLKLVHGDILSYQTFYAFLKKKIISSFN